MYKYMTSGADNSAEGLVVAAGVGEFTNLKLIYKSHSDRADEYL